MPEGMGATRSPVYLNAVRDLYALELPRGGRVELRRQAGVLGALTFVAAAGEAPIEFDLRRWHYRQWSVHTEDREYSEALRALIAQHALFTHAEWITGDRPATLDPELLVVLDDLRATWRGRFGDGDRAPNLVTPVCAGCLAADPPKGPLTVWSPAPTQVACPHRDVVAPAVVALAGRFEELVFELLDLLVVAPSASAPGAAPLRRFVLPSEWMRALLGHWLLGHAYAHRDHPWRARGVTRHRRFSHRALRAEGHAELTHEERYSAMAWGISPDDLSLMPEEPESSHAPDASWWSDVATPPPAGVRIYPEGAAKKPSAPAERARPSPRAQAPAARPAPAPRAPTPRAPAPAPVVVAPPRAAPRRAPAAVKAPRKAKPTKSEAGLQETLSSLTAGLAALSQLMGGPKGGRR